jgi:hypothetical protein
MAILAPLGAERSAKMENPGTTSVTDLSPQPHKLTSREIEAANRAEATALLIRAGFRVYRPEADVHGEDLVVREPGGKLSAVQLKGRPTVEWERYGGRQILMLFPDPDPPGTHRDWFLVDHDEFFKLAEKKHGASPKWDRSWSYPTIGKELRAFLENHSHRSWAKAGNGGKATS